MKFPLTVLLFIIFLIQPLCASAATLFGGEMTYIVEKTDTLQLIGAKLGLDWRHIARINAVNLRKPLKSGTALWINNRKIAPDDAAPTEGPFIAINIPDRMLYYYVDGVLKKAFPVGLGMLRKASGRWRTPIGKFKITLKDKDPIWYVPPSIQREMAEEGQKVKTIVLPGPDNPLGRFALHTTYRNILIHETIAPTSVYGFQSHGCIRVLARDMEGFFNEVAVGTSGEFIYRPIKVALTPEGRVYLEVYPDFYGRIKDMARLAQALIEKAGAKEKVDWEKVEIVLKEKTGVAEDVTR